MIFRKQDLLPQNRMSKKVIRLLPILPIFKISTNISQSIPTIFINDVKEISFQNIKPHILKTFDPDDFDKFENFKKDQTHNWYYFKGSAHELIPPINYDRLIQIVKTIADTKINKKPFVLKANEGNV